MAQPTEYISGGFRFPLCIAIVAATMKSQDGTPMLPNQGWPREEIPVQSIALESAPEAAAESVRMPTTTVSVLGAFKVKAYSCRALGSKRN